MLMCVLLCALRCAAASSLLMVQLHSASSDNRTSRLMNCRWDAGHSPVLWAVARPSPSGPRSGTTSLCRRKCGHSSALSCCDTIAIWP